MMTKQQFEQARRYHIAMWAAELDAIRDQIAATTAATTDGINDFISRDAKVRRLRERERQLVNVIDSFA